MTKFPEQPILRSVRATPDECKEIGKSWLFELKDDFIYEEADHSYRILIPAGFRHDGASVPRIGFTISGLTPSGPISAAALVHDYIYRYRGELPDGSIQILYIADWIPYHFSISRRESDKLFIHIMKRTGIRWSQRWLAWAAVRIGGPRW